MLLLPISEPPHQPARFITDVSPLRKHQWRRFVKRLRTATQPLSRRRFVGAYQQASGVSPAADAKFTDCRTEVGVDGVTRAAKFNGDDFRFSAARNQAKTFALALRQLGKIR
jgi:hypothetical protein